MNVPHSSSVNSWFIAADIVGSRNNCLIPQVISLENPSQTKTSVSWTGTPLYIVFESRSFRYEERCPIGRCSIIIGVFLTLWIDSLMIHARVFLGGCI